MWICVLKMKLDARSCIKKKVGCGVISKNVQKGMETVRFRSSERWQFLKSGAGIAGPVIYLDQDHISSSSTSLWNWWCGNLIPARIYCQILPSADSLLVFCQLLFLPRKCSTAILMLLFGSSDKQLHGSEGRTETAQNTGSWAHLVLKNFSTESCLCVTLWEGPHFPR